MFIDDEISAAMKWGRLQSLECWSEIQIIVHSTSQHNTGCAIRSFGGRRHGFELSVECPVRSLTGRELLSLLGEKEKREKKKEMKKKLVSLHLKSLKLADLGFTQSCKFCFFPTHTSWPNNCVRSSASWLGKEGVKTYSWKRAGPGTC